jgi:hypothetical protein
MQIKKDIREGKEYGDRLFFNFLSFQDNKIEYSFFPRPYDGRDYLKGFYFAWQVDPATDGWEYFYNTVLLNPEFIHCFWVEYRLGFNPDKYWFKIIDHFKEVYDDCPHETGSCNFGKKIIPEQYIKDALNASGIDISKMKALDY